MFASLHAAGRKINFSVIALEPGRLGDGNKIPVAKANREQDLTDCETLLSLSNLYEGVE